MKELKELDALIGIGRPGYEGFEKVKSTINDFENQISTLENANENIAKTITEIDTQLERYGNDQKTYEEQLNSEKYREKPDNDAEKLSIVFKIEQIKRDRKNVNDLKKGYSQKLQENKEKIKAIKENSKDDIQKSTEEFYKNCEVKLNNLNTQKQLILLEVKRLTDDIKMLEFQKQEIENSSYSADEKKSALKKINSNITKGREALNNQINKLRGIENEIAYLSKVVEGINKVRKAAGEMVKTEGTSKPEPGKPEPGKPEPGKPEPGKPKIAVTLTKDGNIKYSITIGSKTESREYYQDRYKTLKSHYNKYQKASIGKTGDALLLTFLNEVGHNDLSEKFIKVYKDEEDAMDAKEINSIITYDMKRQQKGFFHNQGVFREIARRAAKNGIIVRNYDTIANLWEKIFMKGQPSRELAKLASGEDGKKLLTEGIKEEKKKEEKPKKEPVTPHIDPDELPDGYSFNDYLYNDERKNGLGERYDKMDESMKKQLKTRGDSVGEIHRVRRELYEGIMKNIRRQMKAKGVVDTSMLVESPNWKGFAEEFDLNEDGIEVAFKYVFNDPETVKTIMEYAKSSLSPEEQKMVDVSKIKTYDEAKKEREEQQNEREKAKE